MCKGKDQLSASKSWALKGELAVGCPAGASVLCLFPVPWPEAMVCIFRTTAGYRQAGDLSSSFITAHKMTRASLWSQLSLWSGVKTLPLPSNPTPLFPPTPWLLPQPWACVWVCSALAWDALLPLEIMLFYFACYLIYSFLHRLKRRAIFANWTL